MAGIAEQSFRARVTLAIQLLLLSAFGAMAGLTWYFGQRTAEAHARAVAQQSLQRSSARLKGILGVAVSQNDLLQQAIQRRLGSVGGEEQVDLVELLAEMAPAFMARPTLTYIGIGWERDGEYAMLERLGPGRARLRHYAGRADGRREIRNYEPDALGRLRALGVEAWDGYDPRERPFFREAKAAGHPVWTESYIFLGSDERPSALGATYAAPVRDRTGRLIGVTDTDFDTISLSAFMGELQRELPGQAFVLERRRDGTHRVVAHSDYVTRAGVTEADLSRNAAAAEVARLLPAGALPASGPPGLQVFRLGEETHVAGYVQLQGEQLPPWVAVVVLPKSAVAGEIVWQQRLSLLAMGLVSVAGIFCARWVADSLTRPLERLAASVGGMRVESAGRRLPADGPPELQRLALNFNAMADRVEARQAELLAAGEAARERAERLRRTSETLREVARLVADPGSPEQDTARRCVRLCGEAVGVSRAGLWKREAGSRRLRLVALWDGPGATLVEGTMIDGAEYPEYWEAMERDRRIATLDMAQDVRTARLHGRFMNDRGRVALLDVPVLVRGEVAGIFSFHHVGGEREWVIEDEIMALGVADLMALAFEREARVAVERAEAEHAARLARQNRALSRGARSPALREGRITEAARELSEMCTEGLGVARASVWLVRPLDGVLQLISLHDAGRGEHSAGREIPLAQVPAYHAALASGRCIAAEDARSDPRTAEFSAGYLVPLGITSMLDAGIFSRGELVGAVCLEHVGARRAWEPEEEIFCGAVADLAALALETSARRTAEEEIERSRERLRLHIEGMPLAAIDWDLDQRVIGWNPAAERIFGFRREDVLGRDGFFLVAEPGRDHLARVWRGLLAGQSSLVERFANRRADGAVVTCDWHNTPLRGPTGRVMGVTSLVEDVSERVRAEEEIRELNAGLEERVAERTAALAAANDKLQELDRLKSEFLATMSHELRTPLNSIIGFTGILKQGMAGPVNAEQAKQLELVYGSARHLLGLINDLLDLSRIEAGRLQVEAKDFAPVEVLRECLDTLAPMVRLKRLACRVEDEAPGLRLRSDRKRFLQVVMNLANNAVKFTEQGGVTMTLRSEAGMAVVRVADTGPGIKPEHMAGLFQAFRQIDGSARRVYEGTGLGLYLCRKLARLLGGEVGVESEPGRGSVFWLRLPLNPAAPAPAMVDGRPGHPLSA